MAAKRASWVSDDASTVATDGPPAEMTRTRSSSTETTAPATTLGQAKSNEITRSPSQDEQQTATTKKVWKPKDATWIRSSEGEAGKSQKEASIAAFQGTVDDTDKPLRDILSASELDSLCVTIPKVELHAHLSGTVREETLKQLLEAQNGEREKGYTLPQINLAHLKFWLGRCNFTRSFTTGGKIVCHVQV